MGNVAHHLRSIPPPFSSPGAAEPTFDSGLRPEADAVLALGEAALLEVRQRTLEHWVAAGAAWKTLQLSAMHRSRSNQPADRRYAAVYAALEHPWPELARVDRNGRKDAIWLFEREDDVRLWLATLSQK